MEITDKEKNSKNILVAGQDIEVTLLNPVDASAALMNIGSFAAISRAESLEDSQEFNLQQLKKIGKTCLKSGHMTPVRTQHLVFNISFISRVCSHQFVRHSIGVEACQQSQRVIDQATTPRILPKSIIESEHFSEVLDLINTARRLYIKLVNSGISQEDARYILEAACATSINVSFSIQALMHFCYERLCSKSQHEIHILAFKLASAAIAAEPALKEVLVPKCLVHNKCNEAQSCGYFTRFMNSSSVDADSQPTPDSSTTTPPSNTTRIKVTEIEGSAK